MSVSTISSNVVELSGKFESHVEENDAAISTINANLSTLSTEFIEYS